MNESTREKTVRITIDDEDFEVEGRDHTPRELLELAELDPATTYLILLKGNEQQSYRDKADDPIKLHNNMKFVSADVGSAPVA